MRKRKLWMSVLAGILSVVTVLSLFMGVMPSQAQAASLGALQEQKKDLEAKKKGDGSHE